MRSRAAPTKRSDQGNRPSSFPLTCLPGVWCPRRKSRLLDDPDQPPERLDPGPGAVRRVGGVVVQDQEGLVVVGGLSVAPARNTLEQRGAELRGARGIERAG